jgi:drug/metabolite transporter (DMT)-like permease
MLPSFLTTLLFAMSAVSGARATKVMGGTEANFWRLSLATSLLAIYAFTWGGGFGGGGFYILFISGCIGFGLGDMALFQAYPRIGSRLTMVLVQTLASPMAAITEWLWLDHAMTGKQIACSTVILSGVVIALAPKEHLHIPRKTLITGVMFGLIAAYGQGFGAVLSRKAYAVITESGGHIDGITAAFQRIVGGLLLAGFIVLVVKRREILAQLPGAKHPEDLPAVNPDRWRKGWYWMLLNGLAGPTLGVSCYQWALLNNGTGVVMPIVALTPLAVIPLAYFIEGERPTPRSIVGGIIAVIGAVALTVVTVR